MMPIRASMWLLLLPILLLLALALWFVRTLVSHAARGTVFLYHAMVLVVVVSWFWERFGADALAGLPPNWWRSAALRTTILSVADMTYATVRRLLTPDDPVD
jgi:hypothetical protein